MLYSSDVSEEVDTSILKVEAVSLFEMLVFMYKITRRHIIGDSKINIYCR
jgi:hypothetical protein